MQLVKQSYEILEQEIPVRKLSDSALSYKNRYLEAMYKHIERCGRVCYKSEDRITEGSAERFVNGLIKTNHLSVLEHGTIYLAIPGQEPDEFGNTCPWRSDVEGNYQKNSYSIEHLVNYREEAIGVQKEFCDYVTKTTTYITTNYRVIVENGWWNDLQFLCEPTIHHEKRHTVLLHSCIHTYKDLTRHRKMSFSIESTRYCNYSKTDKFGEMKFVIPTWVELPPGSYFYDGKLSELGKKIVDPFSSIGTFVNHLVRCEQTYDCLISEGWQAQQAAEILPQCTAADVVMSGFAPDWKFVFKLRSDTAATGKPHPLVEELMTPLRDEFISKKYI